MQPRATGNKHQVRHQVGHLAKGQDRPGVEGGGPAALVGPEYRVSRAGFWEVAQRRNRPAGGEGGGGHV